MTLKEKYKFRKENGLCTRCGSTDIVEGKHLCQKCLDYAKYNRLFRKENGLCTRCGKKKVYLKDTVCYECYEKYLKKARMSYKLNKVEMDKKSAERHKKTYYIRKEMGICTRCGKRKATVGFSTCAMCRCKLTEYGRVYRQERSANERKDILFDRRAD